MGRNNKIELQYFTVDVNILHDKKVRRLTRKYARGMEFYIYLLCAIYSDKGYYLPFDDDTIYDIADEMRISEDEVREMLDFCMSDTIGLFSRVMMEKHRILTSRGIQFRYLDTIRILKRRVNIDPLYSLISEISSEENPIYSEEIPISSEETPISSEEMPIYSEEKGIYSDKSKVKKSKVKENKVKEISLSAASGDESVKERERFLEILFFEKELLSPQQELDRFVAHYEKSGWLDANGNPVRNCLAALKSWAPDKNAVKCRSDTVTLWRKVYDAIGRAAPGDDRAIMLEHFLGLIEEGPNILLIGADKSLPVWLEQPNHISAMREILAAKFGADKKIIYRVPRNEE